MVLCWESVCMYVCVCGGGGCIIAPANTGHVATHMGSCEILCLQNTYKTFKHTQCTNVLIRTPDATIGNVLPLECLWSVCACITSIIHPVYVWAFRAHLGGISKLHHKTSYFNRETSWELDMSVRGREKIGEEEQQFK